MYIIKCISKLGQVRYLRNKPLGSTKLLWSPRFEDAFPFKELREAQPYRDDCLDYNEEAMIIGRP